MRSSDAAQDLFDASVRGDTKAAMLAMVAHAEPDCCNHDGLTPLMMAVAGGHVEVARLLVTSGAKVNATTCPWGVSAVCLAAAQGSMALLELLLQWKGDTNLCAETGNAPLARAAGAGHVQACTALLEYCADPDRQDAVGITAAMHATAHEHAQVVALLLRGRASMAAFDDRGRSAFGRALDVLLRENPRSTQLVSSAGPGHASKHDTWTELARRMVWEGGADVNLADHDGETPLSRCTRARRQDLLTFVLSLGADQNSAVPALCGGGVLLQAVKERDRDLVQMLLHRAASVNAADARGLTPLFLAADLGDEDLIRLLVQYGAEFHRRDPRTGETLLMRLASRGFARVYHELLPHVPVTATRGGGDVLPATGRSEAALPGSSV